MLEPQILDKPELKLVGSEMSFIHGLSPQTNNFKIIPPLWDRFIGRANEVPNRADKAMYGIMYCRPEAQRGHPDELQYIAAVAVNSTADVPTGMVPRVIPAGTFAVFLHRGPISRIVETCSQIYRGWLPQSGYEHSGIADVEVYDHRFDAYSEDSEMEYWISVRPKKSPG